MLLPLIYTNLKRLGVKDPLLVEAKQCHFDHWRRNQKLFLSSAGFLEELRELGVPTLVLKGVALAHLYYPDTGCRAMADLDLLIPAAKFMTLGNSLLQKGWKETDGHSFSSFNMDMMPSFGFMRPDGFWVDIHCHVLHADCRRDADEAFWSHAQPFTLRQTTTQTLAPEDHLLHVISHGVRWCDVPPFRWIADAWWILARTRSSFDWERFLQQARFHQINLPIFRGLEFMNRVIPLDLPPNLLSRLDAMPVSGNARVRFIVETNPIPKPFFPRAQAIWKALREDEETRLLAAGSGENQSAALNTQDVRRALSLIPFASKIVLRDYRQILAESLRSLRGLFIPTSESTNAPETLKKSK
jgi:hypothetical protein